MTCQKFEYWLQSSAAIRPPLVMGILNVTPDSFSDGGRFTQIDAAVTHARQMVADGADLIDVGGESTRPGADRVDAEEQIRRIIPVIRQIADLPVVISIDTTKAAVAQAAIEAGATLVNDTTGGLDDPAILPITAKARVPIVLMHTRGEPATMQSLAHYSDVVNEVREHLATRRDAAIHAGVLPHRVLLDPGIGFAKTLEHDLSLIHRLTELQTLAQPLVLGVSRKKFIGRITGESEPAERVFGTAACVSWCVANGADIMRVHDVAAMVKVVRMVRAICQESGPRER